MKRIATIAVFLLLPSYHAAFANDDVLKTADDYINALMTENFETLSGLLTPAIKENLSPEDLAVIQNYVPAGKAAAVETIGFRTNTLKTTQKSETRYQVVNQYAYPGDAWLIVTMTLLERDGAPLLIESFNVQRTEEDLRDVHKVELSLDTPIINVLMMVMAIVITALILYTLFLCYRTPGVRRKWLWFLFIAAGIFVLELDWTRAAIGFQPLSIQFLGSGYARLNEFSPLIIKTSLPLGAMIFLWKRRRWLEG